MWAWQQIGILYLASVLGTPMVAVSGYVDANHRKKAQAVGFDGFVSKPFTVRELENVCNRVRAVIARTRTAIGASRVAAAESQKRNRRCQIDANEFWLNRRLSD